MAETDKLGRMNNSKEELGKALNELRFSSPIFSDPKLPRLELTFTRRKGYDIMRRYLKSSNEEVIRVMSPNGLKRNYRYGIFEEYLACRQRGVRVRLVTDVTKLPEKIVNLCSANFELRHSNNCSMRLSIIDNSIAWVGSIRDDANMSLNSQTDSRIFLADTGVIGVIRMLFEELWHNSTAILSRM